MTTHALAFIALVIVAEHQVACGVAPNTAELQAWAFSLMERGFVSESVRAFHTIVDTFGTADPGVWHAWCNYAAAAIFKLDLESRFPGGLDAVLDICMQAERHDPGHPRTHQLRQGIQLELLLRELPPEARSMSPEDIVRAAVDRVRALQDVHDYDGAWRLISTVLTITTSADLLQVATGIRVEAYPNDDLAWDLRRQTILARVQRFGVHEGSCPSGRWRIAMRWNDTNVIPQQITVVPSRLRKAVPPGFIGESFEGIPSEWTPKQVAIVETHEQLWLSGTTMTANVACTVFVGSHDTLQDLHSFPEVVLDSSNDFIVDEHVGVVVQFFYANWYHFVCDGMARIMLFRRRYPELKLLVPPRGIPHVDQVLEFFDLVEGVNLIHLPEEAPRRVALKRGGIFVDWVMVSKPTSIMEPFFPPASAIRDVRNYTCHRFKSPPARSIVFVGRKGSRRIDNENEVVDAMVQRFGPRVQLHDGDAMPVREQIEMFSKARIIIGAHGSGLVNIAFAPPTACLISFPIVPHTKLFFENLSSSLGIAHVILTSVPPSSWLGGFGRFPPAVIKELLATIDLVLDWQTSPSKTCRLTADYLMPPTCREETYVG